MLFLRKLSIFGAREALYCSRLNSVNIRWLVSFRCCLDVSFRDFDMMNINKSRYNQLLADVCFVQLPKLSQRLCHDSARVTVTAPVRSKSEKYKFEEIQVVAADGLSISKMKRIQAEQIAHDKNLKLVLVESASKDSQPLYRLMTSAEYRAQMKEMKLIKRLNKLPDLKTLKLNSAIAEHDLKMKLLQVVEWIQSGHSVKVAIISSRKTSEEDGVFNKIVFACKDFAIVNQATKTASQMLFHLVPKTTPSNSNASLRPTTDDDKDQRPLKTEELKRLREEVNKKEQ